MDPYYRPGPASLRPGLCPGGVIVHAYDHRGSLLSLSMLDADTDLEAEGNRAADAATAMSPGDLDVCLVAYDGDDGHRWSPAEWIEAGYRGPL